MAAFTFGLDISHHQDLGLDLVRCRREGIQFVFLKATEGAGFVDREFATNLAEARAAGLLVAAYHYVRSNASTAAQVANIQRVVPRDVPVIPDVEANSGGAGMLRDFVAALRAAGRAVPLLYLPRWYWQQIGSPDLRGLPPLWSSRYPDNVVGTLAEEWADVPARYWDGYGGLPVAVLQFTSSARIAGHAPLDANAFRGTRAELAALLGGEVEDDDMFTDADKTTLHVAAWRLATALRMEDRVPDRPDVPEPIRGEVVPLVAEIKRLRADVDALKARPAADVDEAVLAAELQARGFDGATVAEVRDVVRMAFARAGEVEGSTT